MAVHKVQGGNMLLFIDPLGGTAYDTVVCLTTVGISDTFSTIDASSFCGDDIALGTLDTEITFDGQHLQDPNSGDISGTDLRQLLRNEALIGWKLSPITPVIGDEIQSGQGYFTDISSSYAFDNVGTFSGTIKPKGGINTTILTALAVGDSYQGGKIAYLDGTGLHGIILAIDSSLEIWSESNDNFYAISTAYGEGPDNTAAILLDILNPSNSAAYYCDNYSNGGYNDWFLASYDDIIAIGGANGFTACGYIGNFVWCSNDLTGIDNTQAYAYSTSSNTFSGLSKQLSGFSLAIPARYF
jgi:hypothetical protein